MSAIKLVYDAYENDVGFVYSEEQEYINSGVILSFDIVIDSLVFHHMEHNHIIHPNRWV